MQTGLEKALTIGIWKWPRSQNRCRHTKRFLAVYTHVCMRLCVSFDLSSLLKIVKTLVGRNAPLVAGSRSPFRFVCARMCVSVFCCVYVMLDHWGGIKFRWSLKNLQFSCQNSFVCLCGVMTLRLYPWAPYWQNASFWPFPLFYCVNIILKL